MRLAVQEDMLPGTTLEERFDFAEKTGIDGIEVWSIGLAERVDKLRGLSRLMGIRVCVVACSFRASLLSPEEDERRWTSAELKRLLTIAGRIGAVGVVYTPAYGAPRLDESGDLAALRQRHLGMLVSSLSDIARHAQAEGVRLLLEPVNRFESYFLNHLRDGVDLCRQLQGQGVGLVANLYHLRLEGEVTEAALRGAVQCLAYARLADSGRRLPGLGKSDLTRELTLLKSAGYDGYIGLDCVVPGQNAAFRGLFARELPSTVQRLRPLLS